MAKKKQTKSECTALVVYEHELDTEYTPPSEEELIETVKEYAQQGYTRGYVARHMQLPEDEFEERFGLHFNDALEELGAQLTEALKMKSFNEEAPVHALSAKFLLERMVHGPKELQIIGAKNSARPIVKTPDDSTHIREPKMSDEILKAMNKEEEKVKA